MFGQVRGMQPQAGNAGFVDVHREGREEFLAGHRRRLLSEIRSYISESTQKIRVFLSKPLLTASLFSGKMKPQKTTEELFHKVYVFY